jgi:Tfp pilus assembly protein PilF
VSLAAYELYLRGEFHVEQLNPVSLARAVDYFTQAVAADPDLAVAWAGLAKAEFLKESWGDARHGERAGAARQATLKALALDPDLAAAHDMMGRMFLLYDRDWSGAETAFRKAIADAPSFAVAYNGYSILLQTLARHDEAVAAAVKARELDPMAPWAWSEVGRALYRARRFAEAEARYTRALDLDPGFAPAVDRLAHLYLLQRRAAEARDAIGRLERLPSSRRDGTLPLRAWLDVVEGKAVGARQPDERFQRRPGILVATGRHDDALTVLERGAADGTLAGFALGNPELDPLRRDPRFARIVASMRLPVDRFVARAPP